MCMDNCDKCGKTVNTDDDTEFYGEDGDGFGKYQSMCETCRDDWYKDHDLNAPKDWQECLAKTMFKE